MSNKRRNEEGGIGELGGGDGPRMKEVGTLASFGGGEVI